MKYTLLSVNDANAIYSIIAKYTDTKALPGRAVNLIDRLCTDTGGDVREIALKLKSLEVCFACLNEGEGDCCAALLANRLGRRLSRLIDRADERNR